MKERSNSPGGKRRGCFGWGLLVAGGLFALMLLLFLAAFVTEQVALAQIPNKYPAPGEIVDIGEYSLHIYCAGDPSAGPVVVVSPGSGSNVAQWALVQPEVARFARICIYDRLGSGWSFGKPQGQTYQEESQDVHTLLQNAGVPGPYVLVGHSLGGAVMQVYASLYPEDIVGMVMVDSRTRGLESKWPPEYVQALESNEPVRAVFAIPGVFRLLNWFGLFRDVPVFEFLAPDLREVAYGLDYNSRFFAYERALNSKDVEREALFESAGPLPDVPLIVIVRGVTEFGAAVGVDEAMAKQAEEVWQAENARLAEEAPQGRLIVAEKSGHSIMLEQPDIVIEAIRTIVERVRGE